MKRMKVQVLFVKSTDTRLCYEVTKYTGTVQTKHENSKRTKPIVSGSMSTNVSCILKDHKLHTYTF